jgi:hypothetical protein
MNVNNIIINLKLNNRMETIYNERDLINFGFYLLSEQRSKMIADNHKSDDTITIEARLREVYHADLENFKHATHQANLMNQQRQQAVNATANVDKTEYLD